jgi:hypothetical protein
MEGHCAGAQRQTGIAAQSRKIDGAGQNRGRGRAKRRATHGAGRSCSRPDRLRRRRVGPSGARSRAAARGSRLDPWGGCNSPAATTGGSGTVEEREREEGRSLARYHVRGSVNGSSALLHGPKCQIYKSSLQRGPYRKGKRKTLYISNNGILGNMHLVKQLIIRATETHNIMQYLGQQEIFWHS